MAITDTAPYAPASAVVRVLETYRETGLGGGTITAGTLARMGLGDEIVRRTLLSLRQLEMIDDDGKPTPNLVAFKQASSGDYKNVLANQLRDLYSPIFAVLGNPSSKSSEEVDDAFRTYRPDSLRKRMARLFIGLCQYAGIIEGDPPVSPRKAGGATKKSTASPRGVKDPPPPPPPPKPAVELSEAHQRYVDLLIKKAESADVPDADLLDRIERALGIGTGGSS